MKIKRNIIVSILIISAILLTFKNINTYCYNTDIKENNSKKLKMLNVNFDKKTKQFKSNDITLTTAKKTNKFTVPQNQNAIGKIVINKIKLDYPILEGCTKENLNISIARFHGSKINSVGNCVLAGHNMKDGSLFGNISELSKGDIVTLFDESGVRRNYKVFNKKTVDPKDLSVLSQDTRKKCLLTLITCTNHGKKRLIIQAK